MMSSLETAATDDDVLHQIQDESSINNSELLTLEDFTLNPMTSQYGIMMDDSSDNVTALQSSEECHVLNEIMDDTMNTNSELKMSVVGDNILNQSKSEAMNDTAFSVFNEQNPTNNEVNTNLKRSYEFEDKVATKKKLSTDDENNDSLMSEGDEILESQTISYNTDTIDLTENDHNNSSSDSEIENESIDDNKIIIDTISISDSEESYSHEISESSDSDVDSLVNDDLKHTFSDSSFGNILSTNLKNKFFKRYPKLFNYIEKDDIIFHEFQDLCNTTQDIIGKLTTMFSSGDIPNFDFFFNREKKWQKIYQEMSQRLKEAIIVIKHYEKDMKNVDHAKPYVVKKTIGLQVEFHSEKEENLSSQLEEHVNKDVFDSTVPLCSNTIEKKQISSPNIFKQPLLNSIVKNTNINLAEESDDKESSILDIDKLPSQLQNSLQPESSIMPTVSSYPAPLPLAPKQNSLESSNKVPPSLTLTVQNCSESRDQKAIELRWNLNINDEELAEIICYQIFGYQEISSEKHTSNLWKKIAEVQALPLPMICTLSFESLKSGTKHYFAIRAVYKKFCIGPFSTVQIIEFN